MSEDKRTPTGGRLARPDQAGNTLLNACIRAGVTLLEARCFMLVASGERPEDVADALGKNAANVRSAAARARRKLAESPVLVRTGAGNARTVREALLDEAREVLRAFRNQQTLAGVAPKGALIDENGKTAQLRGPLVTADDLLPDL